MVNPGQTESIENEVTQKTEAPAVVPENNVEIKTEGAVGDQTKTEAEQGEAEAAQGEANRSEIPVGEAPTQGSQEANDYIGSLLNGLGL